MGATRRRALLRFAAYGGVAGAAYGWFGVKWARTSLSGRIGAAGGAGSGDGQSTDSARRGPAPSASQLATDDVSAPGATPAGRVLRVGPEHEITSLARAAAVARDGDTILITPGDYRGDVAVWEQPRLTLRAEGGAVRVIADGKSAEGKGNWVVRGDAVLIEGVEFIGSRVPHRNGAGIRFERGRLTLRRCRFLDNEMGLLTSNDAEARLIVESCAFIGNGRDDGHNHNLYVGTIDRLSVTASYFARARIGHLLKSRARESVITYNRLSDEPGGRASYELEFPNGGRVLAMGNLIAQEASTENPAIVSYAAEGYRWPDNKLFAVHNTVANRGEGPSVFVKVHGSAASGLVANNLWCGPGNLELPPSVRERDNAHPWPFEFRDADRFDYRLLPIAAMLRSVDALGEEAGFGLVPRAQYVHPLALQPFTAGRSLVAGALQS
ncbi:MAG: hypothetical protein JSW68_09930 [Burkholderiales bacterium]|nr:MAG: hypothetical protein JSW68_09930 [Burkholderiales bacterium]